MCEAALPIRADASDTLVAAARRNSERVSELAKRAFVDSTRLFLFGHADFRDFPKFSSATKSREKQIPFHSDP